MRYSWNKEGAIKPKSDDNDNNSNNDNNDDNNDNNTSNNDDNNNNNNNNENYNNKIINFSKVVVHKYIQHDQETT